VTDYTTTQGGQAAVLRAVGPAEVLRAALTDAGVVDAPALQDGGHWPCFVNYMPDTPSRVVAIYDTTGILEGRVMRTGATVRHPGWQIRVRADDYPSLWARVSLIQTALDAIRNTGVVVDGSRRTMAAVTQTGDALDLGQEPNALGRNNATLNGTMTIEGA